MLPVVVSFVAALVLSPDVVELKDGTRHPGEARSRKDGIELATPLGVVRFARDEIAAVETRAELLPLYRTSLSAARRQPHALISLVRFCLDRGLYPEAFDCLDKALAAAPQEPIARAALESIGNEALLDGATPGVQPDAKTRERLLERVGGRSASRAAFARRRLLEEPADELRPWLVEKLGDLDHAVRLGAADLLGEIQGEQALASLIKASLLDGSAAVRERARASARRSGHPDLASPYLRAIETDDSRIRERAYPALAELRDPRAVPALIHRLEPRLAPQGGSGRPALARSHVFFGEQRAFVQDFEVEIAQGAVIAKPVIGVLQTGVLLDAAVAGVEVISYVERAAVVATLEKLTGQRLGSDPLAWAAWWSLSH
jgi:HEAT repeat protein